MNYTKKITSLTVALILALGTSSPAMVKTQRQIRRLPAALACLQQEAIRRDPLPYAHKSPTKASPAPHSRRLSDATTAPTEVKKTVAGIGTRRLERRRASTCESLEEEKPYLDPVELVAQVIANLGNPLPLTS